jgi:hypothetical protein
LSARLTLSLRSNRALVAACVTVCAVLAVYLLIVRAGRQPSIELQLADAAPDMPQAAGKADRHAAIDSALDDAAGPVVDLASMAERFRRAALVTAIRDAGFVCDDVAEAVQTTTDVWVASCRNMINYRVDVAEDRSLVARPVASYFDQVDSAQQILDDRLRIDRNAPRNLPPQLQRQQ